jgi:O-antigen/teichoic acid export membrane protein
LKKFNKLKVSVIANLVSKVISIVFSFSLVPLLLNYLGVEGYGIWLTIYAFVGWLNMFDLGLGNGLKLKLTEAFSKKRNKDIIKLISSSYIIIGGIVIILIFLYLISTLLFDWVILIGISSIQDIDISRSISILIISFLLILLLKLIGVIYSSLQLPFVDSITRTIGQFFFLVLLFGSIYFGIKPSLAHVALISTSPLILIYLILTLIFFLRKAPFLKLSFNYFSVEKSKDIISPGISFFLIQFCSVILYSTDNLIIINLLSPTDVTIYNISYKFFGLPFIFFTVYIATHWPAFIDALAKKNLLWIKQKIKFFNYLFILLIVCYIISYFLFDFIMPIWTDNDNIAVDHFLNICVIIYYLISGYATIYIYVINASGKIALQKYIYIIIAFINIPLSVLFVKVFNLGNAGVIIASSICVSLLLILIPIQSHKILNNTAKGIWIK